MKRLATQFMCGLVVLLLAPGLVLAQDGTITGTVTDGDSGEELPGANVEIPDLGMGVATGADGTYTLEGVPAGEQTLRISFLGYAAVEETVEVTPGEVTTLDVGLQADLAALDEVRVVGFGVQRDQRDITGSVSSISAEDIEGAMVSSPEQLLQGRTSGVQLTTTSGMAGAAVSVRVRGPSSITGGSQPLYVVDGQPIISGDFGSNVGTAATNALADLNPNDIESIEVLKDASATAIYGSRAANGVVLIETKQGRNQATEVSFGAQLGSVTAVDEWPVLDGPQWAEVYREAFDNFNDIEFGGALGDFPEQAFGFPQLPAPEAAPNTNWVDEVFETGLRQEYNMSIRGGDENTRFFVSGTFDDNQNYVRSNEFRRIGGRANIEHDAFEWAQIGARISTNRARNQRAAADNLVAAPLTSSALVPPIIDIWEDEEAGVYNFSNPWNIADNVVGSSVLNNYDANSWRSQGNAYALIEPFETLRWRTQGSMDILTMEEFFRYNDQTTDGAPDGFGQSIYREQRNFTLNTTLDYSNTFSDVHRVGLLGGFEFERQERNNVFASATGFPLNSFRTVASGAEASTTSATIDRIARLESYFARVDYTYDDRYIFDLSARVDGSSRFGADNRYGFFPAGSVAWRVLEESFMDGVDYLDEFRFRVSYGITGNDQIGFFGSRGLFGGGFNYDNTPGIAPTQLASPDLQWESTSQIDIGMDLGIMDRVALTFDLWQKDTDDLILPVQVPLSSGFSSLDRNVGDMRNRGFDLSLETRNVTGNFHWTTDFQLSYLENEVTSLVDDEPISSGVQRAEVGEPLGTFFLIPWEGVDPDTGLPQWLDQDGNITNNPTADDRRLTGKALPTWTGGITNELGYGGLNLSFLIQFEADKELYNDTYRFMMTPATFNLHEDYLDRWQEPGDQTDVPRNVFADVDNAAQTSTRFLEDGSFVRLKDITLSYQLPQTALESINLSSARIFVRGTNLLTFDRLSVGDPESTFGGSVSALNEGDVFFTAPQQRTITGGVRFTL